MIIAIDGPAGSGKSTVAKLIANRLGFNYLDTGAMYRAVAMRALEDGIDLEGGDALIAIAEEEPIAFGQNGPGSVSINGEDVTTQIRTKEVDKAVTPVSACAGVRSALVRQQQTIGRSCNAVMEGRDIGTVVFPDADVKIFLTADAKTRAHRRSLQNIERGIGLTDEDEILADIERRDVADSTRATSPLRQADDAWLLDTSGMGIEEVVDTIIERARELCGDQVPAADDDR